MDCSIPAKTTSFDFFVWVQGFKWMADTTVSISKFEKLCMSLTSLFSNSLHSLLMLAQVDSKKFRKIAMTETTWWCYPFIIYYIDTTQMMKNGSIEFVMATKNCTVHVVKITFMIDYEKKYNYFKC